MISSHFKGSVAPFGFVPLKLSVETHVSDYPKCQDQISGRLFYRGWSLRKVSRYGKFAIMHSQSLFISRTFERGRGLFNYKYHFNLHIDKSTRTLNGKKRAHKVGGREGKDKNQIHLKCYSRYKLIHLSYVYYIRRERGLNSFLSLKRGAYYREGG